MVNDHYIERYLLRASSLWSKIFQPHPKIDLQPLSLHMGRYLKATKDNVKQYKISPSAISSLVACLLFGLLFACLLASFADICNHVYSLYGFRSLIDRYDSISVSLLFGRSVLLFNSLWYYLVLRPQVGRVEDITTLAILSVDERLVVRA